MPQREQILGFYAITPIWFWPVLWLRLIGLERTFARLKAEGYAGIAYHWDVRALRFVITRLDRPDVADPFAALAPSMEFLYAKAGYMPHNLWALTFNTVPLFRDMARGLGPVRIAAQPILDPG